MAKAKGIRAGRAFVELGVSDKLQAGLRIAAARLKAFGANVRALGAAVAGASAAILAPIVASVREFANFGDTLDKMSARTGVSVETLSALGFAAEQTGTNLETLEKGFAGLSRTFFEAKLGGQQAIDALAEIGLSFKQLEGKSPDDQFVLIADRMGRIADESIRGAVAQKIFGRDGRQLLPMLRSAKGGIEGFAEQARFMGMIVSTEAATSAAGLTDAMNRLWRIVRNVGFVIGGALAPTVTALADGVSRIAIGVTQWVRDNQELFVTIAKVAAATLAAGGALIALGVTISVVGVAVGGLAAAIGAATVGFKVLVSTALALGSPVVAATAAIAALGLGILAHTKVAGDALKWLGDQFDWISGVVDDVVGGIIDALAAGDVGIAAEVLWSGMVVAWETGVKKIMDVWNAFSFAFQSVAIEAFAGVRSAWVEVATWMWKNFPELTKAFATSWAWAMKSASTTMEQFINTATKNFLALQYNLGLINAEELLSALQMADEDAGNAFRAINDQYAAALADAERLSRASATELEEDRAKRLASIEAERAKAIAALEDEFVAREVGAADNLIAALDRLAAARDRAERKRKEVGAFPEFGGVGGPDGPDFDLARRAELASRGTFRARWAGQLVSPSQDIGEKFERLIHEVRELRQDVRRNRPRVV